MKKIMLGLALVASFQVTANDSIALESTTHRVKAIGYDCGEFFQGTVGAPLEISSKGIEFTRLDADKDLNFFLVKGIITTPSGNSCDFGVFLDRSRDTKTLDFNHIVTQAANGDVSECLEAEKNLENRFKNASYYASKRGIRYIAVDVVNGENEVCESGNVRAVFDRRAE